MLAVNRGSRKPNGFPSRITWAPVGITVVFAPKECPAPAGAYADRGEDGMEALCFEQAGQLIGAKGLVVDKEGRRTLAKAAGRHSSPPA